MEALLALLVFINYGCLWFLQNDVSEKTMYDKVYFERGSRKNQENYSLHFFKNGSYQFEPSKGHDAYWHFENETYFPENRTWTGI